MASQTPPPTISTVTAVEIPDTARSTRSATTAQSSVTSVSNSASSANAAAVSTDNGSYTRHNAPLRYKFKPRWHTQPYVMFLALRAMPGRTAARQELINATLALDRKISQERGMPRVFTGKEYDSWMEKLIKHDWPLCFGVPKEGAIPIHILEKQQQEAQMALEQQTAIATDQSSVPDATKTEPIVKDTNQPTTSTDHHAKSATRSSAAAAESASEEHTGSASPPDSRKRVPDSIEAELDDTTRSSKKVKSDQESSSISTSTSDATLQGHDQDLKVTDKMERLELKSTAHTTASAPSTPGETQEEDATLKALPLPPNNASTTTPGKATKAAANEKVDEYRLEDLDLTNVPTSLADILRVDVSTIPNSGNGLFAKVDLPASTPLGFYFGVPMTENEFDSLKDGVGVASHYSIMYRRTVLDATDESGMPYSDPAGRLYCPFHFMNEDPNGNISFITGSVVNQVICTTNRDVKAGEELFVFYGKEVDRHWADQGQDGSGSENSSSVGGDQKKGREGSRSRATSPVRREETTDRPRRNNIYKPARYTR
ncbi:hypothetical protein BGZ70_003109 [Mortierella alpina]|uniref:SET domain-containing protein n=1 Tax=Mortierella alpina TaxID=64518 RepID=A0A9P6ISX9_MORAP|nr:hypothetical protein BGZ70_003109 [Mortierella alpina]